MEHAKQLDEELAALRARFDQYFLGLDRKNPEKDLQDYRRRLLQLKGAFLRNTSLKFRVQSLWQKFSSYERLWLKSLREIEEGTYFRDLAKLRRRSQRQGERPEAKTKEEAGKQDAPERKDFFELDDDLEVDFIDEPLEVPPAPVASAASPWAALTSQKAGPGPLSPSGKPAPRQPTPPPPPLHAVAPPQPSVAKPLPRQASSPAASPAGGAQPIRRQPSIPPLPPSGAVGGQQPLSRPKPPLQPAAQTSRPAAALASSGEGLSSDKVQRIYDAFITAKKRCRESTDGLTLEAVEHSLRKQVPQLMREHNAKSVDFKVVIKDGKAVLKAVPK
ncbi:MAG: hypothetical protein HY901_10600 [Deltaproteobacteria bacterium]|nr:hypothetical protein [Deltaproteobacteria bacterium]